MGTLPSLMTCIYRNIIIIVLYWRDWCLVLFLAHYNDVIMGAIASQITSITIVYWTVYSDADQRKHQSPASLLFVRGIHRGPANSPHKWPVTRKMFPFDDVIMMAATPQIPKCHHNPGAATIVGHLGVCHVIYWKWDITKPTLDERCCKAIWGRFY